MIVEEAAEKQVSFVIGERIRVSKTIIRIKLDILINDKE